MYKGSGDKGHGGERSTSRDLLLALGWLIATGSLEKLLTKRVQQLDKMLLTPTHVCIDLNRADINVGNAGVMNSVRACVRVCDY